LVPLREERYQKFIDAKNDFLDGPGQRILPDAHRAAQSTPARRDSAGKKSDEIICMINNDK
jgi:hypothetical protein